MNKFKLMKRTFSNVFTVCEGHLTNKKSRDKRKREIINYRDKEQNNSKYPYNCRAVTRCTAATIVSI